MYLTRHQTPDGTRLALDGAYLPHYFSLEMLLALPRAKINKLLETLATREMAGDPLLPPLESMHEVWACGVTYLRSREARASESDAKDVYEKIYMAERPELFFKSLGWRVVGHRMPIRIRRDSRWNVPEPELTLVINRHQQIVGYCAGNDVSSRDIEGANPLYLPQAKIYNGSCAIAPGIEIVNADQIRDIAIKMEVTWAGELIYHGETRSSKMKRSLEELVDYLTKEMDFPSGVFLMTGTGLVPADDFSLKPGDRVRISVGSRKLDNSVNV